MSKREIVSFMSTLAYDHGENTYDLAIITAAGMIVGTIVDKRDSDVYASNLRSAIEAASKSFEDAPDNNGYILLKNVRINPNSTHCQMLESLLVFFDQIIGISICERTAFA